MYSSINNQYNYNSNIDYTFIASENHCFLEQYSNYRYNLNIQPIYEIAHATNATNMTNMTNII